MNDPRRLEIVIPRGAAQGGPDPLIGRVINDRYRVVGTIARGGMGKVYRAEQRPLGRLVALKVLNPNYTGDADPEFHKRFFLEASIAAKLTHPNTVTIFDYGKTDDDVYYIAMELLEGRTLHRALREEGAFTPERAMHVTSQICRSLREAHSLGVIHRDLKPANVYLVRHDDDHDFVKVLDFGLVKNLEDKAGEEFTQAGLFMGSPKYMAPEQIRDDPVDARVDVYALGVMLFEMLTGKVPFDHPNSVNILMAHIHQEVPPVLGPGDRAVPHGLQQLTQGCLEKDPARRLESMDEVLGALKRYSGQFGTLTGEFRVPAFASSAAVSGVQAGAGDVAIQGDPQAGQPYWRPGSARESAPPPAGPSQARQGGGWAVIAAGIGAMIIGGLSFWWLEHAAQDRARAKGEAAAAGVTPQLASGGEVPVADPPQAMASQRVVVALRSTPSGAFVNVGDHRYGPTPTEIEWTGSDAEPGREVTFVFARRGYRDLAVTRQIRGERLEIDAPAMTPIAAESGASKAREPRQPPAKTEPDVASDADENAEPSLALPAEGYKAEPY